MTDYPTIHADITMPPKPAVRSYDNTWEYDCEWCGAHNIVEFGDGSVSPGCKADGCDAGNQWKDILTPDQLDTAKRILERDGEEAMMQRRDDARDCEFVQRGNLRIRSLA